MKSKIRTCQAGAGVAVVVGLAMSGGFNVNAELVYGVSDQLDQLVSFDSSDPGALKSAIALTGLASGEQIRGIDWINGTLYGLGDESHLYTINTGTGACSLVGSGSFSPVLNGINFGFSGSASLLYVASDLGQNLTLNPTTGVATALPNYTGAPLDGIAYNYLTSSFFGVSAATEDLYSINPATGSESVIGPTGVNFFDGVGLDISPTTDVAYFSGAIGGQSEFFTVNLSTGAFTLVGDVGTPGEITAGLNGIAATGITTVPEPSTAALMTAMGGGLAFVLMRRRK